MTADGGERTLGRFTEWFRHRATALEFWEAVVTDERLVWAFAGESFRAALLRADMGERTRERLAGLSPGEALALEERNFAVPLADLAAVELTTETRTRRARLTVEWEASGSAERWTLANTSRGEDQRALVEALAEDPAFADVDVSVSSPPLAFL